MEKYHITRSLGGRLPILVVLVYSASTFSGCGNGSTDKTNQVLLTSIAVQPATLHMMAGTSRQFTAIGTFSDNVSREITADVAWNSSDAAKATVGSEQGSAGMVTAVGNGAVEISASFGGIVATATVSLVSISTIPARLVFARMAVLRMADTDQVSTIDVKVLTKPGKLSKDVHFSYSLAYLSARAYVDHAAGTVSVPIVGLYAGYGNKVVVIVTLKNGESLDALLEIQTEDYTSEWAVSGVEVLQPYLDPGTSYLLLDTEYSPTILDIDGETRWQFYEPNKSVGPTQIDNGSVLIGTLSNIFRVNFLGEVVEEHRVPDIRYHLFNHNFDAGKFGIFGTMLLRIDRNSMKPGSVLLEVSREAEILGTWDFDEIFRGAIRAAGEDPSGFVQMNVDWFHINSSAYSARDDSIIVSSRENFVVKVDYSTGKIRWILGNPGKMWYQKYPLSLRPLALSLSGNAPIGQHAISIVGSDELPNQQILLFNNGLGNSYLPNIGDDRTYSAISLYEIDESSMTATEVWTFENNREFFSPTCSSVYKTAAGDYLIDYSMTDDNRNAIIMVVDAGGTVKFKMKIPKRTMDIASCNTAYRAREIRMENFRLH